MKKFSSCFLCTPAEVEKALFYLRRVLAKEDCAQSEKELLICGSPSFQTEKIDFYGTFYVEELIGLLAVCAQTNHIRFLHVDGAYCEKGLEKELFYSACLRACGKSITVNAPFSDAEMFEKLGFVESLALKDDNPRAFVPMECNIVGALNAALTFSDNVIACAASDRLFSISMQDSTCSAYFDYYCELLDNKNSLVRNRALGLVFANMKWVERDASKRAFEKVLEHISDEKPITSRICIGLLPQIARLENRFIPQIVSALRAAEPSRYSDSMRPLIEKDIKTALDTIEKENS